MQSFIHSYSMPFTGFYPLLTNPNSYITAYDIASGNVSGHFPSLISESLSINNVFMLRPSGIGTGTVISLSNAPFYFLTGNNQKTLILPAINASTGRQYIIKNKGLSVTITGQSVSDKIFSSEAVDFYIINSGDSISLINDGYIWCLI